MKLYKKNLKDMTGFHVEVGCLNFIANLSSTYLSKLGLSTSEKKKFIKICMNLTFLCFDRKPTMGMVQLTVSIQEIFVIH